MKKTEIVITTTIKTKKNLSNSKQTDMKLNKFVKSKTNYTTINEKNTLLYTNCLALIKHLLRLLKNKKKEEKQAEEKKINDRTV